MLFSIENPKELSFCAFYLLIFTVLGMKTENFKILKRLKNSKPITC